MGNILISETWVNKTENYIVGESEVYETFTDDKGKLFKNLQREYGRCISKVYVDEGGETKTIGWIFEKTAYYTDTKEKYIQETWITLHNSKPVTTIKYDYMEA